MTQQAHGGPDVGYSLLESIAAKRDTLRPSDARVADVVLNSPESVVGLSIAGLAAEAGVSEPTVIRFCTAVGFEGYRAFKIALAKAVALSLPIENSAINHNDSMEVLSAKVFQRTISSLDRARASLDPVELERAVDAITKAKDILFIGMGASAVVALDGQQKFPLFGIPCHAYQDAHIQFMAAGLATSETVGIVISETARTTEILRAAQALKSAGGTLVVVTGNDGPIAELSDIELRCTTHEDTELFTPTVSRLAALVVIDILASAVAMRRPPEQIARVGLVREMLADVRGDKDLGPKTPSQ